MSQGIKIPVSADVGGAERAADQVAQAFEGVGDAVGGIDKSARDAATSVDRLVTRLEELRRVKAALARDGVNLSDSDADTFLKNWDGMRSARGSATARVRQFNSFPDWDEGIGTAYSSPREAAAHRRRMYATALQGTDYAKGTPGGGHPGHPGGGGGGFEGGYDRGLQRAGNAALSFSKSMLALAGITSVMGMAAKAIDLATEESTGLDTLKRRTGDLGVEFDKLRDQARLAGNGLGVSYVESQRMAQQYARVVGNLTYKDVAGMGGQLRTSYGFARSYGLDPNEGTQFFGQMRRYGVSKDEESQRRLALMIGDAVSRSGYYGKVDELLGAVADYTIMNANQTLTTPNVEAFTSGITSLLRKNPIMDPGMAAGIINQADQATRRGGGMGEASLNFMYSALRNFSPGLRPVDAMALMQGGLFGTTAGTFGRGPLAGKMGQGVGLDNVTNFDKMIPLLRKHYGNGGYMLNAVQNTFGLSSMAQAAALTEMSSKGELGATSAIMDRLKLDPMKLSADGWSRMGRVANAKPEDIRGVYEQILSGLKGSERRQVEGAMAGALRSGSPEEIRDALVEAVAMVSQEKTAGLETRDAVTGLTDILTSTGGPLLSMLNPIRTAVEAMAFAVAGPNYKNDWLKQRDKAVSYGDMIRNQGAGPANKVARELRADIKRADEWRAKTGETNVEKIVDHILPPLDPKRDGTPYWIEYGARRQGATAYLQGGRQGVANVGADTVNPYNRDRIAEVVAMTMAPSKYDDLFKEVAAEMGLDWRHLKQIGVMESGLNPNLPGIKTPLGQAFGLMQVVNPGKDWRDPRSNIRAGALKWKESLDRSGGDMMKAWRGYYGGPDKSVWGANTEQYTLNADATYRHLPWGLGKTPPGVNPGSTSSMVKTEVEGRVVLVNERNQPVAPPVELRPVGPPRPAGSRPAAPSAPRPEGAVGGRAPMTKGTLSFPTLGGR